MNERALRVLEFTKIRDMLSAYALSEPGKEKCRSLPSVIADEIGMERDKFSQLHDLLYDVIKAFFD